MCAPLANRNWPQISIKLAELKLFNSNTTQAQAWLSALKHHFIVVGITYIATNAANTEAVCYYTKFLMAGNAVRWMDKLEVQGHALNSFLEFDKLFIDLYTPPDGKNITRDKSCKLW